jgi:sugar lactone lactonase YvrE
MKQASLAWVIAVTGLFAGFSTQARALTLFVANTFDTNGIVSFTSAGVGSAFASFGDDFPGGVAFDSSGNLYVAITSESGGQDHIEKFNSAGVGTTFATGVSQPRGLAFNSTGNLFVANSNFDTIEEFTPSGVGTVFADTDMNSPGALAFNATGTLFVANEADIVEFNSSGVGTIFASSGLSGPTGLAFNATGTLFVANQNGYIQEFTPAGVGTHFVRLPLGVDPVGLAFNSTGTLFVTTTANTIVEYSPSAVSTLFASSDLDVPTNLAFNPVPEPPASVLLAGTLGALLALGRRRFIPKWWESRTRTRFTD